jgi:cytochrome c peroxidase
LYAALVLGARGVVAAQVTSAVPLGLPPVPASTASSAVVELGRKLFADVRLSTDGSISCVSCHVANRAFSDGLARSKGQQGQVGMRNAPSLLNVAYFQALFWDGRATSLEFSEITAQHQVRLTTIDQLSAL